MLQYIVSINSNSEQLLAEATVNYDKEQNLDPKTLGITPEKFSAVTGKWVEATINAKKVALGNPKMMAYANTEITFQWRKKRNSIKSKVRLSRTYP